MSAKIKSGAPPFSRGQGREKCRKTGSRINSQHRFTEFGPRRLWHEFTSILANAGIPTEIRMKLTCQKDADVHAGYTHHGSEALTNAVSRLPNL
jgi:hypothetical protein